MADYDGLRKLIDRVRRLESTQMLQNASVTEGRVRFIGGLLRVDSGGRVEIEGTLQIEGATEITGTLDLTGIMTVDGAGEIRVGSAMVLDPATDGGSVVFGASQLKGVTDGVALQAPNTQVVANSSQAALLYGNTVVEVADNTIWIVVDGVTRVTSDSSGTTVRGGGAGTPQVQLTGSAMRFNNIPIGDIDDVAGWIAYDSSGNIMKIPAASGGPMGMGDFAWPFSLSLVTNEYDPNDPNYTNGHLGIDFGSGIANIEGTPIPAAAGGTILANDWDSERGWYVIIDHGTRGSYSLTTRYYHLYQQSPLAEGLPVSKGQSIGGIGTTGLSTGYHLHFETRRNGAAMNPRTFMSIYGE